MSEKPAAIMGQIVDMKNVAAHKSVRLYVDIPQEHAPLVLAAFGWATMTKPVDVAIARLAGPLEAAMAEPEPKSYAQQAAIMGAEPAFWRFANEMWSEGIGNPDEAAIFIRRRCSVASRSDLWEGTKAGNRFRDLRAEYQNWLEGRDLGI